MAKSMEQLVSEQFGALTMALCAKDARISELEEELGKLKALQKPVREPDKQPGDTKCGPPEVAKVPLKEAK